MLYKEGYFMKKNFGWTVYGIIGMVLILGSTLVSELF